MKQLLIISVLSLLSIQAVQADSCMQDVKKFCKDITPGGGRIQACLKQHNSELSADCKKRSEKITSARDEIKDQCKQDVQKLCSDEIAGKGRKAVCLKENMNKLSQGCRSAMKDTKAHE